MENEGQVKEEFTRPTWTRTRKRKQYPRVVKSRPGRKGVVPWGPATKHAALVTLLALIDKGKPLTQAVRGIATRYGCHEASVWRMVGPYRRKTTAAATRLFQVSAFDLAKSVIEKGSPAEHLDILTRPNIGVLEPVKKVGGDGGSGLFISVQVGSCGGVAPQGPNILASVTPKGLIDGETIDEGCGEVAAAWAGEDGEPQRG